MYRILLTKKLPDDKKFELMGSPKVIVESSDVSAVTPMNVFISDRDKKVYRYAALLKVTKTDEGTKLHSIEWRRIEEDGTLTILDVRLTENYLKKKIL